MVQVAGFDPDDMFYEHPNESRRSDDLSEESEDATAQRPWSHPIHYVYDAAAERMKERMKEYGIVRSSKVKREHD